MGWSKAKESREQIVLFPGRLDDAISKDHRVRILDDILGKLDWSEWEAGYDLTRGQPPFHPRVLASVILYGLLVRIRSSRALEEALLVRLDFRWLVEGRTIDHTTLSEFRRKHPEPLKLLFVQIAMVARELGCLSLESLAFDGTRMRASNRRSGSRTPDALREIQKTLAEKFEELEARLQANDLSDEEQFGESSEHTLDEELADAKRREQQIEKAIEELDRMESAGEEPPKRLPLTDPDSRIMPNKTGGYAPNYTPTATVDTDSGIVVAGDVLNSINEDNTLLSSVESVQENFGLDAPPGEVLADGLMATGENIAACEERKINLLSPIKQSSVEDNPAVREDLTEPVAAEDYDRLPTKKVKRKSGKDKNGVSESYEQLDKHAFVYDDASDSYWCPAGKCLSYRNSTSEKTKRGVKRVRRRYSAEADDCAGCPLQSLCVAGKSGTRKISREQHESVRMRHAKKMSSAEAQEKYSRRSHAGERPFASIKQLFGARQFLLRGLSGVKQEWDWMLGAFNLHRLLSLIPCGTGPPPDTIHSSVHPP
jgi:transposase